MTVEVGTDDPRMVWLEYGTPKMPPRPAVAIGTAEAEAETLVICVAVARAVVGDDRLLLAKAAEIESAPGAA